MEKLECLAFPESPWDWFHFRASILHGYVLRRPKIPVQADEWGSAHDKGRFP